MAMGGLVAALLRYTVVGGGLLTALVAWWGWRAGYPLGLLGAILFGIGNVGIFLLFSTSDLAVGSTGAATGAGFVPDDASHVTLSRGMGQVQVGLVLLGPGVAGLLVFAAMALGL